MPTESDPIVGQWYTEKGQDFQVVSINEDDHTVSLQYIDAEVEEVDIDAWYEMDAEPTSPPDDYVDDLEDDDTELAAAEEDDWTESLDDYDDEDDDDRGSRGWDDER